MWPEAATSLQLQQLRAKIEECKEQIEQMKAKFDEQIEQLEAKLDKRLSSIEDRRNPKRTCWGVGIN